MMCFTDPPTNTYGVSPEIELYYPMKSTEFSIEQKPSVFAQWVSSYFQALPEGTPVSAEALRVRPVLAVPHHPAGLSPRRHRASTGEGAGTE